MKISILAFAILLLLSCSKDDEPTDLFLNCDQIQGNYQAYNGETIDCQFHYWLTEYNDQKFIELRAHCADLTRSVVINENCEDICETLPYDPNSVCGQYLQNRKEVEILFTER